MITGSTASCHARRISSKKMEFSGYGMKTASNGEPVVRLHRVRFPTQLKAYQLHAWEPSISVLREVRYPQRQDRQATAGGEKSESGNSVWWGTPSLKSKKSKERFFNENYQNYLFS